MCWAKAAVNDIKNSSFTENKATLLYSTCGTVAAVNIGQEQLHMWGKNSCTCPFFAQSRFTNPTFATFFSDKRQSKLNVRFEPFSVDVL